MIIIGRYNRTRQHYDIIEWLLGKVPFLYIFVVLSSLAALFALFPPQQIERLWLPQSHLSYCSSSPSSQVVFKKKFSENSVLQIVRFMIMF